MAQKGAHARRAGGQRAKIFMPGDLLIDDDVARRLRISKRRLRDLLSLFPFYRYIGSRRRFTEEDYQRIVEALPRPSDARRERPLAARKTDGVRVSLRPDKDKSQKNVLKRLRRRETHRLAEKIRRELALER